MTPEQLGWMDEIQSSIEDFAIQVLPGSEEAIAFVDSLRRLRPRVTSKEALQAWAVKQITARDDARDVLRACRKLDLDVQQYLDSVYQRLDPAPPFPDYITNGNAVIIAMTYKKEIHPWAIPADWLERVTKLWPMHLRPLTKGRFYVAKKLRGQIVPVHRLFVDCETHQDVIPRNGNFLDYTNGNLLVASATGKWSEERQVKFEKKIFGKHKSRISDDLAARVGAFTGIDHKGDLFTTIAIVPPPKDGEDPEPYPRK